MDGSALAMWKSLALPSLTTARTSTMNNTKQVYRAPSATPWDNMPSKALTPAERVVRDSQRSIYRFRHAPYKGDVAFFNSYPPQVCPRCCGKPLRNGKRSDGLQRYRCSSCKMSFTPVTGTIFDNAKLTVAAWADFILQAISFESISAMIREDRRSNTTSPYWMEKLFLVLDGIQDGAMCSKKVWIDETYWPVAAKDAKTRPDGSLPRGLSINQICIAAATDQKVTVMFETGCGKPSRSRIWNALGNHIAKGSLLVHDKERAHKVLIERLGLKNECYNAKLLKGIPDELNPLNPINKVCFLIKCMFRAHSGFDRAKTQGYLDLLYVALNPPNDKLEKVALVLNRAMCCPKSLKYRSFYQKNPS